MRKLDVVVREMTLDNGVLSFDYSGGFLANKIRLTMGEKLLAEHPGSKIYFLSWDDEYTAPYGATIGPWEVDSRYGDHLVSNDGTMFAVFNHISTLGPGRNNEMVVALLPT